MRWADLAGRRVAVWGAGREGTAAWRAFLRHAMPSPRVTLLCSPEEADALRQEIDARTLVHSGPVTADLLRSFDFVIKSPGISPYHSPAREAIAAGVRFVSGSALWFGEHPRAKTIAITGTKGKSTTTAMVAHLLRAAGRRVALAGNIGLPLLELPEAPVADWYVFELSSFQTRDLEARPTIAAILNLFPEHLDWHGDERRYYTDKCALLRQTPQAPPSVVLGGGLVEVVAHATPDLLTGTQVTWFNRDDSWTVRGDAIWRDKQRVLDLATLPLPGEHNAINASAALAIVEASGEDAVALAPSLATFQPLPHRLQCLGERDGFTWVDDSIATTPYATMAALDHWASRAPTTVLVGGHDRGVSWETFRDALPALAPNAVITMGANGGRIAATLSRDGDTGVPLRECITLGEAVAAARAMTPAGGVILLSPGAPSFGEFRDYIDRGRRFAALAGFDPERSSTIAGLGL